MQHIAEWVSFSVVDPKECAFQICVTILGYSEDNGDHIEVDMYYLLSLL